MTSVRQPAGPSVADLVRAAEPRDARPIAGLLDRLATLGDAGLHGARSDGRPIGPIGLAGLQARGVTYDSRRVAPGMLFVAVPGEHVDGHDFVESAVAAGAIAAIVERPLPDQAIPQIVVGRAARALAAAAAWWYGDPSHELAVVGVTGTDGKTTTSFLAAGALRAAGISTGLMGTVEIGVGALREPNAEHVTTPQAPELQSLLRAMVAAGNRAAVIETTSHGLALDRVAEVAYDAAILTNLTTNTWSCTARSRRTGPPSCRSSSGWPAVRRPSGRGQASSIGTTPRRDCSRRSSGRPALGSSRMARIPRRTSVPPACPRTPSVSA
jgi:Mur ligase middle domain/Mur ligase family, catalytic domain